MKELNILLIDDEQSQVQSLKSFLSRRKHKVFTATNGPDGLEIIKNNLIDLVLTDYRMPEWDGYRVLQEVKKLNPEIDVVIITAFGTIENAVELMKAGAYDFLSKPVELDKLQTLLERIYNKRALEQENKILKEQLQEKFKFKAIISQSKEMENVVNMAGRVASSKASILIRGESGTGKELIAKAIHYASPRNKKPFVTVNMAALSENLIESELFGHEKGAFTGANQTRIGRFEEANGGTLFIDEVGDIPLNIQVKLLRAIQFGEFEKLGSGVTQKTDVRIIAATHQNLEELIKNRLFREDLFYRLNVISINIPPLRKRKSDILPLVDYFMKKFSEENGKNIRQMTPEAKDLLMKYSYPGNIRELENIIERAVVLCRNDIISAEDLPFHLASSSVVSDELLNPLNLEAGHAAKMQAFEKEMLQEALNRTDNNKSAAARLLQITERHLRSRLERLYPKQP